jgi:lipoprotein signal peptidase
MIWGGVFILFLDLFLQIVFRLNNFGIANRGLTLGIGSEIGLIISVVSLGLFFSWMIYEFLRFHRNSTYLLLIGLGGLGNVICRVIWGNVWDYVCIPFLPFCFNLSDVLISLGVVSYILGVNGNRSTLRGQRDTGNQ